MYHIQAITVSSFTLCASGNGFLLFITYKEYLLQFYISYNEKESPVLPYITS